METTTAWRAFVAEQVATWPTPAGAVVVGASRVSAAAGEVDRVFGWASVTKVMTALTVVRLATRGLVRLDEPAGPPGSTLRHLLSHASGLACDTDRVQAPPATRRIYSNRGIEVAARHVEERVARRFSVLVQEELLDPLGMRDTELVGSPAHGARGPVHDLARLAHELLTPQHLTRAEIDRAASPAYPGLSGVLPGFGRQDPNDWGLGFELRGRKAPHWTSASASPASFGHFGQSGSFLWVDRELGVACVAAGAEPFGPWATEAWPRLLDGLLARAAAELTPQGHQEKR